MTVLFIKLLHLIAVMAFFGLPFAFGRWLRSAMTGGPVTTAEALRQIRVLAMVHLNCAALVTVTSGLYLAFQLHGGLNQTWLIAALVLTVIAWINLNLMLVIAPLPDQLHPETTTAQTDEREAYQHAFSRLRNRLLGRFRLFAASHHTLLTLVAILMIFRPA